MKIVIAVSALVLSLVLFLCACGDKGIYKKADRALSEGNYQEAVSLFSRIPDYEDSAEKLRGAKKQLMLKTYGDEIALLEAGWWVTNGGSDETLDYYVFSGGDVKIGQILFDGNGRHETKTVESAPYEINSTEIVTRTPDGDPLKIPYTLKDGAIELDGGRYYTAGMIQEGLQGFWNYRYSDYIAAVGMQTSGEYNVRIDGDTITYEKACPSAFNNTEYFYYGPYSGTFQVDIGCLKGTADGETLENEWFYNVINGEIKLLHYANVTARGDGLPGEDGYYHLLP